MLNEELIIRFLTRNCTQEELLEVENWLSNDRVNADLLFEMERVWSLKNELHYSDRKKIEAAYRRFIKTVSHTKQQRGIIRRLHSNWMKYAAAIVIACLLASNIYMGLRNKHSDEVIAENIMEIPAGQRASITLSDGTRVWLNSGSILSYPAKFDNRNRAVRLDGEGYFEVTASMEHPFVVHTGIFEVTAFGTKFNVQAYPDNDIAVSLLEGQLHIQAGSQSALMQANDLVAWSEANGLVHYKNKEVQRAVQWTSGELMFVDEPLANIAKTLERKFGVTIVFDAPELAEETFTCRTQPDATLEQVLNLLKSTKKLNYAINGKMVRISR